MIEITDNIKLYSENCFEFLEHTDNESIQAIYLDPPFNTKRDYQLTINNNLGFSDKWNDEDYKKFVNKLVEMCKKTLKRDGTLFFHICCDSSFMVEGILRNHFPYVSHIFWKKCRSKNNVKNKLGSTIEFIFKCSLLSKPKFNLVYQEKDEKYLKTSFNNEDEIGKYSLGHVVTEPSKQGYMYDFIYNGRTFSPPTGWRVKKDELDKLASEDRLHFPKKGTSRLYKKIYLHENPGKACTDLWDDIHSISQGSEIRSYPTAKPVRLLERIISIASDPEDLIMDPCCGSGTTGLACRNLNRKCLLNDINKEVTQIVINRINS